MKAQHWPSPADAAPGVHPAGSEPPPDLLAQVAARLRPVCAEMSAQAFDALVLDIARFTLRWGPTRRPPV